MESKEFQELMLSNSDKAKEYLKTLTDEPKFVQLWMEILENPENKKKCLAWQYDLEFREVIKNIMSKKENAKLVFKNI